jgi:membrane protease YdiL (CAAX protease family)
MMSPILTNGVGYLIVVVFFAAYHYLMYVVNFPFNYIYQSKYAICDAMNNSFCPRIAYTVAAVIFYWLTFKALRFASFQVDNELITNFNLKFMSQGALLGGGTALVVYILNLLLGFTQFKGWAGEKVGQLFTIFSGMVMTGLTEEVLFRGLLVGMAKKFMNPYVCILISSVAFGYVHLKYSVMYFASALIKGILLGLGQLRYGLFWCIGLHSLFNFIETSLYTLTKIKVVNKVMGGARETPDDDGLTTTIADLILIGFFARSLLFS